MWFKKKKRKERLVDVKLASRKSGYLTLKGNLIRNRQQILSLILSASKRINFYFPRIPQVSDEFKGNRS